MKESSFGCLVILFKQLFKKTTAKNEDFTLRKKRRENMQMVKVRLFEINLES